MSDGLVNWALPRLSRLLPLDEASLREVVTYTASLSKEAAAEHLKNLLGDSPPALEFISSFNARREEVSSLSHNDTNQHPSPDLEGVPRSKKPTSKKAKAPLHSAGPVRRPDGYGDVAGAYRRSDGQPDYVPSGTGGSATALSTALSFSTEPEVRQTPKVSQTASSSAQGSLRRDSPSKLPPSASGSLISDLPNVRAKQSKKLGGSSGTASPKYTTTTVTATTSSINDLTSAIAALEISTNPSLSSERRQCPCNASIHPLFTTAPNCLNCGKIICALEGLQPCSFCNSPILTKDQVSNMIRALKEERGQQKMNVHNAATSNSGRGTPLLGALTPESGSSGDEASSAAARARAHRDKLLSYQRDNVQRTKVHDEAADYDVTLTPGATQWMSPVQRAAALKKQQQYLREMEEANKPEYEKRKTVMSMSIKNGKLVKTYENVRTSPEHVDASEGSQQDTQEAETEIESSRTAGKGAFSNNPLLASGKLVRPIWKAPAGAESNIAKDTPRKSIWRRVQDDNDDNEQWILDGGAHGFTDDDS